jgi:hypothetical protein
MSIADGKYRAKAAVGEATLIESGKGTPGVTVELELQAEGGVLERLSWTGWLSEGAYQRTVESLRYLGWKGADLDDVKGLDQEVEAVVKAEEYEGNWYPRVQFINRLGGAMGAAMTGDKAKAFAASMRSRIQALDAAGPRPRTPAAAKPAQAPAAAAADFDIPF